MPARLLTDQRLNGAIRVHCQSAPLPRRQPHSLLQRSANAGDWVTIAGNMLAGFDATAPVARNNDGDPLNRVRLGN